MKDAILIFDLASLAFPAIISMIDLDFIKKNKKDDD